MKVAQTASGKHTIQASASAPDQAVCPHCGGTLILRRRRCMNNAGHVYFWRHRDNRHRSCSGRSRPLRR